VKHRSTNNDHFDRAERLTWNRDVPVWIVGRPIVGLCVGVGILATGAGDRNLAQVAVGLFVLAAMGLLLLALYSDWTPGYTWRFLRWHWRNERSRNR
jgi:hypothetical protein